jgi:serine/threonine-protein kinase
VARFQNEARAAGNLRHENIVSVYDLGQTEDGANYIVMEHCDGRTCEEHLRDAQRFALARAVDIVSQVCSGLAAAHAKNIVHRDLKPANLLLTARHDGSELVKLLDFGVAKLSDDSLANPRTQTGLPIGTPLYMSPEQTRGERDVDQRTDIYAVGVLLFELLSGSAPFADSPSTYDVLEQIRHSLPPSLDSLVPDLPRGVSDVAARAMDKQRSERFATALELAAALRACIEPGHTPQAVPASPATTNVEPAVAAIAPASPAPPETLQAQPLPAPTRATRRRWSWAAALLIAGGVLYSTVRVRVDPGTPYDPSSAIDQLSNACEGGTMPGCTQLAMAYAQGIGGLTQDFTRAVQLYTRACDGGDMPACARLGCTNAALPSKQKTPPATSL